MFVKEARRNSVDYGNTPTQTAELGYKIMKAVDEYRRSAESQERMGKSEHHFNVEVYGELMAIAQRYHDDFVRTYEDRRMESHGEIW